MKITSLTPEQINKFPEYVEKGKKIGLSTEPADRKRAENAIKEMYKISKLKEPKIVWCDSPLSAYLTILIIEKLKSYVDSCMNSVGNSVMNSVGNSVRDSVWNSVWDSVGNSVRNSVGNSVMNSVWNSVWDSVINSVGDSVWNSVMNSVGDSVMNSVGDSVWDSVWNSVRNSVMNSVGDSVWDSVWDSVRNSVMNSVRDSVWNSVWDSVGNSVGNSVMNSVGNSVRDSVWNSVWNSVGDSVMNSVGDSVMNSVWDSVRNSVGDSVMNSVWNSVRNSVMNSVWNSVMNSVWNSVRNSVGNSVRDSVGNSVWNSNIPFNKDNRYAIYRNCIEGSHLAHIAAFYKFFRDECGLFDETENGVPLYELIESCGWIFPYENICFASERHNKLNMDNNGRLSSSDDSAVEYPDGYKIYAINGIVVPEYFVMNQSEITVEKIEKEENVEIRRIMIDRYVGGIKKYFQDSGAELIDEKKDIHSGLPIKLWKKIRNNDSDIVMVEMKNKTKEPNEFGEFVHKSYYIRVKPDITDALEAISWHHNQTKNEYILTQKGT